VNVSPSALWLGGDVMSKAQAQKHRAVSRKRMKTPSHQEQSWWLISFKLRDTA